VMGKAVLELRDRDGAFSATRLARVAANAIVRIALKHSILLAVLLHHGDQLVRAGIDTVAACLALGDVRSDCLGPTKAGQQGF
jgi:hypothetical protein